MPDFPEYEQLQSLLQAHAARLRVDTLTTVNAGDRQLLVQAIELGASDPALPAVAFIGGVHGRERIGSQVVIAWLHTLLETLRWDTHTAALLTRLRLLFVPIVNPGGMLRHQRANPAGVDLMRNAPVEADGRTPWLAGGHRVGPWLPWYRGPEDAPMQPEAQALVELIRARLLPHPLALSLDCHSGFGARNRIWFPWARTRRRMPHLAEVYALRKLFRAAYPNHVHYRIEPQSLAYLTHGDLWDYLYDESLAGDGGLFLPLTLEMGSWRWARQHPGRFLLRPDLFNPLGPYLKQRVLRQHLVWFDFLLRAAASSEHWLPRRKKTRKRLRKSAKAHWPRP